MSNKNNKGSRQSPKSVTTVAISVPNRGQAATRRQPKQAKNRAAVNLMRDGYLATLLNPFGVHGIRIPDQITAPSSTVTLRYRDTITAKNNTTNGNYAAGFLFTPTAYLGLQGISTYTGATNIVGWGAAVSFPSFNTFNGLSREYRVVSAGLGVYNTTAMASNQGRNVCAFFPGSDTLGIAIGSTTTVATLLNCENCEDSPLNNQMVCSLVWNPSDPTNTQYHLNDGFATGLAAPGANGYYYPGQLCWIADGISSTASFEVVVTLNIEFQPNTSAIDFFPVLPSRYDVGAMMNALNSPIGTRRFGTVQPQDIMVTSASNNFGLSSFAGQLLNNFGSGAKDVLLPAAQALGRSLTYAATLGAANYVSGRRYGPDRFRNALLGIPAGL